MRPRRFYSTGFGRQRSGRFGPALTTIGGDCIRKTSHRKTCCWPGVSCRSSWSGPRSEQYKTIWLWSCGIGGKRGCAYSGRILVIRGVRNTYWCGGLPGFLCSGRNGSYAWAGDAAHQEVLVTSSRNPVMDERTCVGDMSNETSCTCSIPCTSTPTRRRDHRAGGFRNRPRKKIWPAPFTNFIDLGAL
jgi:hypothetical protein